jgi:hypothetical protein
MELIEEEQKPHGKINSEQCGTLFLGMQSTFLLFLHFQGQDQCVQVVALVYKLLKTSCAQVSTGCVYTTYNVVCTATKTSYNVACTAKKWELKE